MQILQTHNEEVKVLYYINIFEFIVTHIIHWILLIEPKKEKESNGKEEIIYG